MKRFVTIIVALASGVLFNAYSIAFAKGGGGHGGCGHSGGHCSSHAHGSSVHGGGASSHHGSAADSSHHASHYVGQDGRAVLMNGE